MDRIEDEQAFFSAKYDLIGHWTKLNTPGEPIRLGDPAIRRCRFCGRGPPEATFALVAHAIPLLLGNRRLLTLEECDDCNGSFGKGIENQLGNWSKPVRTFTRVMGRSGIPTLKGADGWRVEAKGSSELSLSHQADDARVRDDPAKRTLTFRLQRDTYVPAEVLRAFVKIGLTLMPLSELPNFRSALSWVRPIQGDEIIVRALPLLRTVYPGPPFGTLDALLLRRKPDVDDVFYAQLVLVYGNEVWQVPVLSPERDAHFAGRSMAAHWLPAIKRRLPPEMAARVGEPQREIIDLASNAPVRGGEVEMAFSYDQRIPVAPAP